MRAQHQFENAPWFDLFKTRSSLISYLEHNLSRLAGASMAEGDILLFMDSHCECYPNWLVPLIQHVACDRTSIAVPGNYIDAVPNSY